MQDKNDFQSLGDLFANKSKVKAVKPPVYQWQELALRIIKELNIPPLKKSSVFKVCRDNPKEFIERCLADTNELCKSGEKWRYFLKLINKKEGIK